MTSTFSPTDIGANLVLSNGNLTVAPSGSTRSWRSVRSNTALSSGVHYFEVYVSSNSGGYVMAGVMNASASLSNYAGSDGNGIGCQVNANSNFEVYRNGAGQQLGIVGSGFSIGIAIDVTNGLFWVNSPNAWNGQPDNYPENGVGSSYFTLPTGAIYFAVSIYGNSTDNVFATAFPDFPNFSHSFGPYGFLDWDGGSLETLPTLPAGYTIWNANDEAQYGFWLTGDTLASDNQHAGIQIAYGSNAATAWRSIRSNTFYSASSSVTKITLQATCLGLIDGQHTVILGLATASAPLTTYCGGDVGNQGIGFQVFQSSQIIQYMGGNTIQTLGAWSVGPYLQFAFDFVAQLLWVQGNATYLWNNSATANPALGIGGISFAALGNGPFYMMLSMYAPQSAYAECGMRFALSDYPGLVPVGYTPWDTYVPGSPPPPAGTGFPIVINPPIWAPSMPCFELPCGAQGYYRQIGY